MHVYLFNAQPPLYIRYSTSTYLHNLLVKWSNSRKIAGIAAKSLESLWAPLRAMASDNTNIQSEAFTQQYLGTCLSYCIFLHPYSRAEQQALSMPGSNSYTGKTCYVPNWSQKKEAVPSGSSSVQRNFIVCAKLHIWMHTERHAYTETHTSNFRFLK